MATMAQEETQGFREKEELLVHEAPQASGERMEKKETQCLFQVQ